MKIYIVTDNKKFFGQLLMPWESIDIYNLESVLCELGEVILVTFDDIVNGDLVLDDSIVISTSSQQGEFKNYIDDVLLFLSQKGNLLIPSLNMIRSHENKGYQELHKKLKGIESLKYKYIAHFDEVTDDLGYPVVCKKLDGYGSSSVKLVNSGYEVKQFVKETDVFMHKAILMQIKHKIAKPIKKNVLKVKGMLEPGNYYEHFNRIIMQEFVPGLIEDYKVIVMADKYFVLTRKVKEGDFRASGSGDFEFAMVNDQLLNYAKKLFKQFNEPMLSLDICFDGENFQLIEFQGTHFGPYTVINSEGFYRNIDSEWIYNRKNVDFEYEVALAYKSYIEKVIK